MSDLSGEHTLGMQTREADEGDSGLRKKQAEIIDSILSGGIKSGIQLAKEGKRLFTSKDNMANIRPYWTVYAPYQTDEFDKSQEIRLRRSLYNSGHSVMPVMVERSWERAGFFSDNISEMPENIRKMLEQRLQDSALVIFTNEAKYEEVSEDGSYKVTTIDPADFLSIVLPQEVFTAYQKNKKISEVSTPIISTGYIQRPIGFNKELYRIPDYETPIIKIASSLNKPVAISGIRLPADKYDIEFLETGNVKESLFF